MCSSAGVPSEGKACTFGLDHFQQNLAELEAFDIPLSCASFLAVNLQELAATERQKLLLGPIGSASL